MNEIDLLIEDADVLYSIEMKKHADPKKEDIKAFKLIDKIPSVRRGPGDVVCLYDNLISLGENDKVIPVSYL